MYPAYRRLPERSRQLLDAMDIKFPEVLPTIVRVDQSEPGVGVDQIPCTTPTGLYWCAHQCRALQGFELMRLQGFVMSEDVMDNWSSNFLQDLAGNSFCVFSGLVFTLVGIAGMAVADDQRGLGAERIQALTFVPGAEESKSDAE